MYDEFAADFSATRQHAWPEFEILAAQIKKNDKILDLGCGNARLRKFLDKKKIPRGNYFGFDKSKKLLEIAKKNFPHDHFFCGDFAKKLIFENEKFDVVAAIASFHHLQNFAAQQNFWRESARILRPGGRIFLTNWILPRKFFWPNFWRLRFKNWIIPFGEKKIPRIYRRVSARELENFLRKNNFRKIAVKNFFGKNLVAIGEKI